MEHTDWDNVLQYVAEPLELAVSFSDKPSDRGDHGSQIPTPPLSNEGSPLVDDTNDNDTIISISMTFHPGASHQSASPDIILFSSDSVFFYVISNILLSVSDNGFDSLLSHLPLSQKNRDTVINVSEDAAILNIILHTIYGWPCAHFSPSFSQLSAAVKRLPVYGIEPKSLVTPCTPLYLLLLSHAPLFPLELYTLAASFDMYDLAVSTSSHLLSLSLSSLTDEMASAMGAVYLKRLFFLHFGRSDALKRVLLSPPHPHPPTQSCDFSDQKKLTRAWALASAYLAWDARPDLSTNSMESALRPLEEHLGCEDCKYALRDRIKNLIVQWSIVKRTI